MNNGNRDIERGYTSESLKMLESEEGQLNAVFACFGSAAQYAQLFEQSLSRFLTMYNKVALDSVTADDIGRKMTMGQLLAKVRKYVNFDDDSIERMFTAALEERNNLIHSFFLERDPLLGSAEGRMELLSDLVRIGMDLDRCRVAVNAMRIAMCEAVGIKDDWAHEYSSSRGNPQPSANISPFSISVDIERTDPTTL